MTLADIVGRGVPVQWHEAVAVVRAVAERGISAEPASLPELHEVELLPNGHVAAARGAVVDDPVGWLVDMLETLMRPENVPPHIAELIAQPHESPRAFSESLAYFERPNRVAVLQELYSRANRSLADLDTSNADELITSLRAAVVPPSTDDAAQKVRISHRRRLVYAAVGLAVVGGLLAWTGLARRGDGSSSIAPGSSALTARVSKGVTGAADAVAGAIVSITGRVGRTDGTAQPPAPVEAEKPKEVMTRTPRAVRDRRAAKPEDVVVAPAVPSEVEPPAVREGDIAQPEPAAPPQPDVPVEPVVAASAPPDEVVYSASSPGVTAPVGLRPHLPKATRPGLKPEDLVRIELVIGPDGNVASAKLVGQPLTVHDSMLLSAAKSWRFRPARKDNTPVAYRLTILVAR